MIQEAKFRGLSHSPSDYEALDGELGTCLNLINEDGTLKTIFPPKQAETFTIPSGASIQLVHKVNHDDVIHSHYIVRMADGSYYWTEKGGDGTRHTIDVSRIKVNAVTAIGNILCFVGDQSTMFAYWSNGDYTAFDLTAFKYSASISYDEDKEVSASTSMSEQWDTAFSKRPQSSNYTDVTLQGSSIIFNALDSIVNKRLDENGIKYFKYTVFGVLAVRLYDGSYINISNPFILAPRMSFNKFIWRDETKVVGTKTSIHAHSVNVTMSIPDVLQDLIQGVAVFLTPPESFINTEERTRGISRYKCYVWNDKMASGVNSDVFSVKSEEDSYHTFDNLSFYLSVSIPKEKFGTDVQLRRVLETEESIQLADMKRNTFGGHCAITYNNRLHIGNVKQDIYSAFDTSIISKRWTKQNTTSSTVSVDTLYLNDYFDIPANTSTQDYILDAVFKVTLSSNGIKHGVYYGGKLQYPISPILSFPSLLASSMEIFFYLPKYGKYFKKKVLLRRSDTFGMSYYMNISDSRTTPTSKDRQTSDSLENMGFGTRTDTDTEEEADEMDDYMYRFHDNAGLPSFIQLYRYKLLRRTKDGGSFGGSSSSTYTDYYWDTTPIDTGDLTESTKAEYDAAYSNISSQKYIVESQNLIKVSDAENPFVFPAANSVQVGSAIVSALAANTQPISEGQFGEAPLYAFTDEGVWTLMTSQTGTYDARQPASRDICSNPSGILQTDDAVLFPTERGIIMQEGRSAKCITDALDGYPFDFLTMPSASKVLAKAGASTSEVQYMYFRDFLKNADMVYDYTNSRIVVFHPQCDYAYVYSLKSGLWGAMRSNLGRRVNVYPDALAIDTSNHIVNLYQSSQTAEVDYFLCTRPLTLGQKDVYKTIFTAIARGYFRNTLAGKCGIVLYGSNDLAHWYLVASSVNQHLRGMAGSPYKYFRICLLGTLNASEAISGLTADLQPRWQNKLR